MTASITETEDGLEAMASIVDAVAASVGDISADGLRRIEVVAGTGDVVARLVDMVQATTGDDWVEAGVIVEVGFTGGNPAMPFSRIVYTANQFVFADPSGQWLPVVIDDGVAYFNNARIKDLTGDNIAAHSITGDHVGAGSLNAGVVMEQGTVITDLIAQDSLTRNSGKKSFSGLVSSNSGGFVKLAEFTCDNPNPTAVNFLYNFAASISGGTNGNTNLIVRIVRNVSGTLTVVSAASFTLPTGQTSGSYNTGLGLEWDDTAPQGTYTYELQYSCTTNKSSSNVTLGNCFMSAQWWLR